MKSVLKVARTVGIVIAILMVVTLLAWVSWHVLPQNHHQDKWTWDTLPPFPLSVAVWLVGIVPTLLLGFVSFILWTVTAALLGTVEKRFRRKPSSKEQ